MRRMRMPRAGTLPLRVPGASRRVRELTVVEARSINNVHRPVSCPSASL